MEILGRRSRIFLFSHLLLLVMCGDSSYVRARFRKKVKIIPVPLRQKLYSTVRFGRFAHSFVYENMGETEVFCHVWQPCLFFFFHEDEPLSSFLPVLCCADMIEGCQPLNLSSHFTPSSSSYKVEYSIPAKNVSFL